jgi:hypothetical protein
VFIFFDGNRDKSINIRPVISEININVLNYYFGKMRFRPLFLIQIITIQMKENRELYLEGICFGSQSKCRQS